MDFWGIIMRDKHSIQTISIETAKAAVSGDVIAINEVINHYQRLIIKLSGRFSFDEFGNRYFYLDQEVKTHLETKLIRSILRFKFYNKI